MAKKKKDGHHGGAWKVAYADFVTAMMALFMVLWICSQNETVKEATSSYFQDPYNALSERTSGLMDKQIAGADTRSADTENTLDKDTGYLKALAREFYKLLNVQDEAEKSVDVEVTSDGLKLTLYDRAKKPLFKKDTAEFTEWGKFVTQTLAWLIERHDFRVYIDGFTSKGYAKVRDDYGAWELSADRANASRRGLEFYAVNPSKMERVTGFGDTIPLPNQPPESENNQRIVISLSLQQQPERTKPLTAQNKPTVPPTQTTH